MQAIQRMRIPSRKGRQKVSGASFVLAKTVHGDRRTKIFRICSSAQSCTFFLRSAFRRRNVFVGIGTENHIQQLLKGKRTY